MENLKKALQIRRNYNKMAFNEFAEMFKGHIWNDLSDKQKIQFEKDKDDFEFSGLNNVDFFTKWIDF